MKRLLTVLLLLFSLAFILTSCKKEEVIHTKEEITAAINAETDKDGKYASNYLDDWKFPGLNYTYKSKIRSVETLYRDYFVKDLPDAYTMAKGTAELFLEHFYDDTDLKDPEAVTDGLIACYVRMTGDPYSFYRTAEEYDDYDTDMSGEFAGIGVTITYDYLEEKMTVTAVSSGGGADDAGILSGDVITKADGKLISELGYQKAISVIRGEEGTRVKITVDRGGEELEFEVERKHIVEETVTYEIDENKIGYIKITEFKEITFDQFKAAIDAMKASGAEGVVYDLRGNPGGYLRTVVDMISYIVPKGTEIVSFTNDYANPMKSTDSHTLDIPCAVICDGGTASAGELFTASMRDFGRGDGAFFESVIVGETTYGKGVMQNSYEFTDGSAITLTVAYYNPPSKVNYDGIGIKPDVEIADSDEGDPQLDKAIEEVTKLINKNN